VILAAGQWECCYVVSRADGVPVAIESWGLRESVQYGSVQSDNALLYSAESEPISPRRHRPPEGRSAGGCEQPPLPRAHISPGGRIPDGRDVLMESDGRGPVFLAAGSDRTNTCDKVPVRLPRRDVVVYYVHSRRLVLPLSVHSSRGDCMQGDGPRVTAQPTHTCRHETNDVPAHG
jgi:hypothetical protein